MSLNRDRIDPEDLLVTGAKLVEYHHINSIIIVGGRDSNPKAAANEMVAVMKHHGFNIHAPVFIEKFIGYAPDRRDNSWSPPAKKVSLLLELLGRLRTWKFIPPTFLESILGHWIWLAQLDRSSPCIPFACYKFIARHERSIRPQRMWNNVRQVLRAMRGSLGLIKLELNRPVLPIVGAADATGFGDGLNCSGGGMGFALPCPREVVETVLEYRIPGRREVASLEPQLLGKRWLKDEVYLNISVPYHWYSDVQWLDVTCWKFRKPAPIDDLELQSQLVWFEILCKIPELRGSRGLGICDNSAAFKCLSKGRSKVFRLNRLCR